MLGLGETRDELLDTLADLLDAGCDMLTLGQYLQPSPEHLPVVRYVPPEEFDDLGRLARRMGFAPGGERPVRALQLSRPRNGRVRRDRHRPALANRAVGGASRMRHNLVLPDLGLGDRPITISLWLVELGAT